MRKIVAVNGANETPSAPKFTPTGLEIAATPAALASATISACARCLYPSPKLNFRSLLSALIRTA